MIEGERHFVGAAGIQMMSNEAHCMSKNTADFRATQTRATVGQSSITEIRTGAYSARRTRDRVNHDRTDDLHVIFVVTGALRVRQDARDIIVGAGGASILRTNAPFDYAVSSASVVVVLTVPTEKLAASTIPLRTSTARIVPAGLVVTAALAYLRPYLEVLSEADGASAVEESILVMLATAVVSVAASSAQGFNAEAADAGHSAARDTFTIRSSMRSRARIV